MQICSNVSTKKKSVPYFIVLGLGSGKVEIKIGRLRATHLLAVERGE